MLLQNGVYLIGIGEEDESAVADTAAAAITTVKELVAASRR